MCENIRKILEEKIRYCLDLILDHGFPLQLAVEYVFTDIDSFVIEELENRLSNSKNYNYIDLLNHEFIYQTDLKQFAFFAERQRAWYFVFLSILDPGYYERPAYAHFNIDPREMGFVPSLTEKLRENSANLNVLDQDICRHYIPVLQKLRDIVERYCQDRYRNYQISKQSTTSVWDLFNGLRYYYYWEKRLDCKASSASPVKIFFERYPEKKVGTSTFYRLKDRIPSRLLKEFEFSLNSDEIDYLRVLLLLSQDKDIEKHGRDLLYKAQYFIREGPEHLEDLRFFIFPKL